MLHEQANSPRCHLYSEEAEAGPAMPPFLAGVGCTTLS